MTLRGFLWQNKNKTFIFLWGYIFMISFLLAFALQQPVDSNVATAEEKVLKEENISWYTEWDQAVKDAKRLNKPIMLQSASPSCREVPGMW